MLGIKMKTCLYCQKQIDNLSKKFCNNSCAASFNNKGVRRHGNAPTNCLVCNKFTKSSKYKFCSNKCQKILDKQNLYIQIQKNQLSSWRSIRKYLVETIGHCQECGINEWNNKNIVLECDHIDGDKSNNVLSNARLLCPNCHSQTSTFKTKNIGNPKGVEARQKRYKKMAHSTGFEPV